MGKNTVLRKEDYQKQKQTNKQQNYESNTTLLCCQ